MMLRVHKLMWYYLATLWPLWTAPLARPWVDEAKAEEEKFIGINPHRRARHEGMGDVVVGSASPPCEA